MSGRAADHAHRATSATGRWPATCSASSGSRRTRSPGRSTTPTSTASSARSASGPGQKLIPKTGGYDQMLEVLRGGGVLSFLADQDAGQRGLYVDFFGRPASTHKAIALLAIEHQRAGGRRLRPADRAGVPLRGRLRRDHRARGVRPAPPTTPACSPSATPRPSRPIIRRDPEQYLWLHRRWKHQPKPKGPRAEGRRHGPSLIRHLRSLRLEVPRRPVCPDPHGEPRAVGRDRHADELAPLGSRVGDQPGSVFPGCRRGVLVELVRRLDRRDRLQEPDRLRVAPFFGPLFMTATVGAIVRTSVGWFEIAIPWWVTWKRSIGPIRSTGQTSCFSTFQVRSPQSRKSNFAEPEPQGQAPGVVARVGLHGRAGRRRTRGFVGPAGDVDHLAPRGQHDRLDPPFSGSVSPGLEAPFACPPTPSGKRRRAGRPRPGRRGTSARSPSAASRSGRPRSQ